MSRIVIRTDSLYVVDNKDRAVYQWSKSKWTRSGGAPVLNADLWKELIKSMQKAGCKVDFEWIKGHAKNEHNKAADRMARESAKMASESPRNIVHVRKKLTSESVQIGCVQMMGQRFTIRIITTQYLKVQKVWKCKYEVMTKNSPFFGYVDVIFSDPLLAAGHTYFVLVNKESKNPRIVKIFKEII